MWDAQAFQIELGIEHYSCPEINLEQLAILAFENLQGERFTAFLNRMNDLFELGKHGLTEKRAADVVDLAIDDVGAHLRIGRLLKQIMGEQLFVKSRSHFGEEDRVISILKELV